MYLFVCYKLIEETGQYPKLIFGIQGQPLALFNEFWFLNEDSNFSLSYDAVVTFFKSVKIHIIGYNSHTV